MHSNVQFTTSPVAVDTYSFCNTTVRADSPFPELVRVDADSAAFTLLSVRPDFAASVQQLDWTIPDSNIRVLRDPSARYWCLEFSTVTKFYYEVDRNTVWSDVQGDCDAATIRHYLLDQVLPRVLSYHGQLMLHSSVIAVGDGAVAFMASTGVGKSSLALAMHELGQQVLCDDCFGIEFTGKDLLAIPTYRSIRLWPHVLSGFRRGKQPVHCLPSGKQDKCRVSLPGAPACMPLIGICLLKDTEPSGTAARIAKAPLRNAFITVLDQTFRFNAHSESHTSTVFGAVDQLVDSIPIYDLEYRRGYELLPQVCADICRFFDESVV